MLLQRAADATAAGNTPDPGQYVAVETRKEALAYVTDEGGDVLGAYVERRVTTTYVPQDLDDVWVTSTYTLPPTTSYGGRAVRLAADRDYAQTAHRDDPETSEAEGGRFGNGELGGEVATVGIEDIPDLSRDPVRLLSRLEASGGVYASRGERVIGQVGALLRSGLVPRDLRSALYDALARLPDVVVIDEQTSLDGRLGTAIGVHTSGVLDMVVIDVDRGAYLGQRQVQLDAVGPVPANTTMDQSSVRVSVVDAPTR